MHIATALQLNSHLYPQLECLQKGLQKKSADFSQLPVDTTHSPDAVRKDISEEFYGYINEIFLNIKYLKTCQSRLYQLPLDDTPRGFAKFVVRELAHLTRLELNDAPEKFDELKTYNIMLELSGALNNLSISLSE